MHLCLIGNCEKNVLYYIRRSMRQFLDGQGNGSNADLYLLCFVGVRLLVFQCSS